MVEGGGGGSSGGGCGEGQGCIGVDHNINILK